MEVGIVDCEAITMENALVPVDTQAITVEKSDKVNSAQITKLRPSILTLTYKIDDPNTKIIPFLPRGKIEKSCDESTKFGRTEKFDVFLNDECMSRNYIHIYTAKGDSSKFMVKNFSSSKPVVLDGYKLEMDACRYIKNKSVLQLDIITFTASIQGGDQSAETYIVHILPEKDSAQQICTPSAFVHDLHWPQMSPQVQNSLHWPQMSPQIQNSSPWLQMQNSQRGPQMPPQNQNSQRWPQMPLQDQNSQRWPQMPLQDQNSQRWPQMLLQDQNSQRWPQMPPQNQNSQRWPQMLLQDQNSQRWQQMPLQNQNSQRWSQMAPPIHSSLKNKSECSSVNKIHPSFSYPSENGSSLREPQEHAMSSEEDFHSEKQKQYRLIEDMSRK